MRKLTFFILCLEGAVLSFNVAACAALIPSVSNYFGVGQFVAGKIVWLYMLPYGLAALFYGPLVRIIDAKKVELVCLFLFSLANLLAALSQDIKTLFVARFLTGIFGASVIPLILILLSEEIEPRVRGKFVGIFFSSTFIASLLGLFLSGVLYWRMIFLIPAIAGFILLCFIYFYLPSFKPEKENTRVNYIGAFKSKAIVFIFTYIFLISLFYHGIQQWLSVYFFTRYNMDQFLISMLITLTSLSGIFGEAIGGWLSDSIGRIKTVKVGIVLMIASVSLLILKMPFTVLIILMTAWGLGWTFNHAGISTMLTDLPREFINEAASLNSSVRFISGGLGTVLAGFLMQRSFALGFGTFAACLFMLFVFGRRFFLIGE